MAKFAGSGGSSGWNRGNLRGSSYSPPYKTATSSYSPPYKTSSFPTTATRGTPYEPPYKTQNGGGDDFKRVGGAKGSNYNALLAAMANNMYGNNMLDAKKAAAQAAYDRGMAALNAAYGSYMSALDDNLSSTKGSLLDAYKRSKKSIMDDSRSSLKQAYVNKVLQEKNLNQQMAAQGLSGGATETTRASMSNNYGNARNEINTTTNNNLSSLEGDYNKNLADAMQAYNMAVANAQLQKAQQVMALEEALANNEIAALDDYYSLVQGDQDTYLAALQTAIDNSGNFTFDPTTANNAVKSFEFHQGGNFDNRNYNNLLAALQAIMNQQGNNVAVQNPLDNNYLAAMLKQLGG